MSLLLKARLRWMETSLSGMDRFLRRIGRTSSIPRHLATGLEGEDVAFFYLRRKGYVVVARGWKSLRFRGDLDLVAWDGETLCFVEVKTRSSKEVATAESAVDKEKRRVLRRLAGDYLRSTKRPPVRFDIISVYLKKEGKPEILHFPGAFGWSDFRERY
jgi:putative endonuclease